MEIVLSKAKKDKKFEQMVADAVAAAKRRRKSKAANEAWRREYSSNFQIKQHHSSIESLKGIGAKKSILDSKWKRVYSDDELKDRERKAVEEAERKAKNVGVPYNKGAYQYLGSGSDVKDIGKKSSQID